MISDRLDLRVLGAVRPIDAMLRTRVARPLLVSAPGARIMRNGSGLYVIAEAPGTSDYSARFQLPEPPQPAQPPAIGSVAVTLTLIDPSGRYLPRRATVAVPRDPDRAHADQVTSLFRPIDVELFAAPTAPVGDGWATIRVSVKRPNSDVGLPFAFLRVRRASDDVVIGRAMTDERGEALIGIPGIPVTTWNTSGGSTVTASSIAARIAACFDKDAGSFPDPASLEQKFATLPHSTDVDVDLTSGREVTRRLEVPVPP